MKELNMWTELQKNLLLCTLCLIAIFKGCTCNYQRVEWCREECNEKDKDVVSCGLSHVECK
jgi:hypothetical protein